MYVHVYVSIILCRYSDNNDSLTIQFDVAQNYTNVPNYLEHVVVTMSLTINTTRGSVSHCHHLHLWVCCSQKEKKAETENSCTAERATGMGVGAIV